jgi:hypothetical protein
VGACRGRVISRPIALQRKALALQDAEEPDSALPPADTAPPPVAPFKRLLADCASEYIAETAEHKSVKTLAAYKLTVMAFCEGVKKEHIEDITREDILNRCKSASPKRHNQAAYHHEGPADVDGFAGRLVELQPGYNLGDEEEEHHIDS